MDIQTYKYNLIEELTKIQDIKLLERIASFLKAERDIELTNAINSSLEDAEKGNTTPHEQVMDELRKKYST